MKLTLLAVYSPADIVSLVRADAEAKLAELGPAAAGARVTVSLGRGDDLVLVEVEVVTPSSDQDQDQDQAAERRGGRVLRLA